MPSATTAFALPNSQKTNPGGAGPPASSYADNFNFGRRSTHVAIPWTHLNRMWQWSN